MDGGGNAGLPHGSDFAELGPAERDGVPVAEEWEVRETEESRRRGGAGRRRVGPKGSSDISLVANLRDFEKVQRSSERRKGSWSVIGKVAIGDVQWQGA